MSDKPPPSLQPYQTPPEVKEARRPIRFRAAKLAVLMLILFGGGVFAYRAVRVMRNEVNLNRLPADPNREPIGSRYPARDDSTPENEFDPVEGAISGDLESVATPRQTIDLVTPDSAIGSPPPEVESASAVP
ncbi:hypothetical protein RMSM_05074 [Rhodopirellula maiorica SM1]|uniref:Uncharacterized protein n=1 Tax=Rhodopirellula maiorica SM1 TaxID=1265738 RepID=M5RRJ0_9BACT|nr:hypothetical protein [Rhodopirellula maiorica]EMI18007.1 hypothetical protein RMSM_05074 [Rhodopirellula maiorica SM1]